MSTSKSLKEERLCKIVWNSNNWVTPCVRVWNPIHKGDPNKPYEQKCGFVHEDWLFNTQFHIGKYQYGYIRGFEKLNAVISKVDLVHLFTINTNTKERFYIGKLFDVEKLSKGEYNIEVKNTLKSYLGEMKRQLKEVGADFHELNRSPFYFNMRVPTSNIELFQEPVLINDSWFNYHYKRNSPNKVNPKLKEVLESTASKTKFTFTPSTPYGKAKDYLRQTKSEKRSVSMLHQKIETHLYNYLLEQGFHKINVACDTTSFGGNLADIVIRVDKETYSIYEIKTDIELRRGLRESVGQLLDYANWEQSIKIKELVSVLPETSLSDSIKKYIRRVKQSLNYKFRVLLYDKTNNQFNEII